MGFNSFASNDDARIDAMGAANPITELHPEHMTYDSEGHRAGYQYDAWGNVVGAIGQGIVGGAAAIGRVAYDALSTLNKSTTLTYEQGANVQQTMADQSTASPPVDQALQRVQDWAKIDPRVTGTNSQVVGTLARGVAIAGLGTLAGGPTVGAPLTLAATEGYNDYRESIAAGLDPTTAAEKAGVTGAMSGAGAFLPMKFGAMGVKGLAASMAGGAVVNTGFGLAQRMLTSEVLRANGYKEMAEQYGSADAKSMAADAILGLAFGGVAHLTHGSNVPAAERPSPDMVEDALDARRASMMDRAGPGIATDPYHANLDAELQDRALGNMLRGKPVDVQPEEAQAIVDHSLSDPERVQLNEDYDRAGVAVHGDIADFSEPARAEVEPEPYPTVDAGAAISDPARRATDADGQTAPSASVSKVAQETLRQLALRHPDLEVELPDGRMVPASEMQIYLNEDYQRAAKDADLHDVAVSCFLRTLG